jgi:hypothetical protein
MRRRGKFVPKPEAKAAARVTFRDVRTHHPWATYSGILAGAVSVVTILGFVVPWVVAGFQNIETVEDVKNKLDGVKSAVLLEHAYADTVKAEVLNALASAQKANTRVAAWNAAQEARLEAMVFGIPAANCDIRILDTKSPMTVIERQACARYRDELGQAKARAERALIDANNASK